MIKIKIEKTGDQVELNWSKKSINNLKICSVYQQGPGNWIDLIDKKTWNKNKKESILDIPNDVFFDRLEKIWNLRINYNFRFLNYKNKLEKSKKYLEIGSGISILGLALSKIYDNVDFYFLDKDLIENVNKVPFYNFKKHAFYNKFNIVKNCIRESNINKEKIHLLTPESSWPNNIDILTSFGSYCWHYSVDVYLDKIIKHSSTNSHLILEIIHQDRNLEKIVKNFGNPEIEFLFNDKKIMIDNATYGLFDRSMLNLNTDGPIGGRYLWIKS